MGLAMRDPSVVIGFDGSRSAMQAALWAIDEAVYPDVVDPGLVDDLLGPLGRVALDATQGSLLLSHRQCRL
jgi:hypothetical protein